MLLLLGMDLPSRALNTFARILQVQEHGAIKSINICLGLDIIWILLPFSKNVLQLSQCVDLTSCKI